MVQSAAPRPPERWAVILAGGNGSRLLSLTRKIAGCDLPKQFCPLVDGHTLLEQTQRRVSLAIAPARTLVVVTRKHQSFYAPLLMDLPCGRLLVQPDGRGTGAAIVYALLRLSHYHPEACVAFFPSDHYVDDDWIFMRHVLRAFEVAKAHPQAIVILGIAPNSPETSYGWIEPGTPLDQTADVFRVARFCEKPSAEHAHRLWRQGSLWNSFVMVARVPAMLTLIRRALPELWLSFEEIRAAIGTPLEEQAVEELYATMEAVDFSRQVLPEASASLAVLPVTGVAWSDLGEPQRVNEILAGWGLRSKPAAA